MTGLAHEASRRVGEAPTGSTLMSPPICSPRSSSSLAGARSRSLLWQRRLASWPAG